MRKRDREVQTLAKQYGAKVCHAPNGHLRIVGDGWAMTCASTPSDKRGIRNLVADLRRFTTKEQSA